MLHSELHSDTPHLVVDHHHESETTRPLAIALAVLGPIALIVALAVFTALAG
jgi:hypothetical protein